MSTLPALLVGLLATSAASTSSARPPPLKILQGGYNATYSVLEFDPYATPNTLAVVGYYDTHEGNLKPWLIRHPVNPNIVLGSNDNATANASGYMTSYSLDARTGALTFLDAVNTGGFPTPGYGVSAAHCAFFASGDVAGVANYYGQTAATFRFDAVSGRFLGNNTPIDNGDALDFSGYVPRPGQLGEAGNFSSSQATAHPHQIVTHPWLPVLYVPDLGEDRLHIFRVLPNDTVTRVAQYQLPYGRGPRHVAIDADGRTMYLLQELGVMLRTLAIHQDTGEVTQAGEDVRIYPPNATFSFDISAAEVHVSNDGRFVYASNRNLTDASLIKPGDPSDTIAVWSVSPVNGTLKRIQSAMAPGGRQLRSFELSPTGTTAEAGGQDYLVTGGLTTNNTFVYKRDRATGLLTLAASTEGTYQPSTYLWL